MLRVVYLARTISAIAIGMLLADCSGGGSTTPQLPAVPGAQSLSQGRSQFAAQERKQQLPRYKVTELGTLGGTFSEAVGVSNRGAVAGYSTLPGDAVTHAFFWLKGVMTDLGTLGGPNSFAPEEWPPNERGEVAGLSDTSKLDPNRENFCGFLSFSTSPYICRAFVWRHGVMTALPTLGGNNGAADAINDRGQLTGVAETTIADSTCVPPQLFDFKAAIWEPNHGGIQELRPLRGDTESSAAGINDNGEVVGTSGNCAVGPIEAVVWRDGRPTNLGSLGGAVFNIAFAVNDRGQVVGQSDLPGDTTHHAFIWQDGVMTDLGTLPGDVGSTAVSVNNRTQVVGFSFDASGNSRPVLWQNGSITDLNTLIRADSPLLLLQALGTNDRGQVAGSSFEIASGNFHGFVATPCDRDHADSERCEDHVENATASQPQINKSPKVVLPENVRKMLRERMARWYRFRGFGVWPVK